MQINNYSCYSAFLLQQAEMAHVTLPRNVQQKGKSQANKIGLLICNWSILSIYFCVCEAFVFRGSSSGSCASSFGVCCIFEKTCGGMYRV